MVPPAGQIGQLGRPCSGDHEGRTGWEAVSLVDGEPGLEARRARSAGGRVAGPPRRGVHRTDDHVRLAGETGHGLQRPHVADAREEHLGAEQGEKTVGGGPPTGFRLGEVLQAGEREQALATPLTDHGRQVRQRGDVRHLVEDQGHRQAQCALGGGAIGGGTHLFQEGDDDGRHQRLVAGWRAHVYGVGAASEPGGVEIGPLRQFERPRTAVSR